MALVSLLTAVRNGEAHLAETIAGVLCQTHAPLEWLVWDDGSSDRTVALLEAARAALAARSCTLVLAGSPACSPARGCGFGRNRAAELASPQSQLFVVLDADDVCAPERCAALLSASRACTPLTLLGSRYWREGGGRPRDLAWHNGMSQAQLVTQRLRETTLAIPTWAFTRELYERAGRFVEAAPNEAEDLLLFYAHLRLGGALHRCDAALLMYRHTEGGVCALRSVPAALIFAIRVAELEAVLATPPWCDGFSIWNAGREGKKLYRALCRRSQALVRCFADVDESKLARALFDDAAFTGRRIPIRHFSDAPLPLLLCVKAGGLAGEPEAEGSFESNLASLKLQEGTQYLHFA